MRKITTEQFKREVSLNPAWASMLKEPVEITDFCDMHSSNITHLSPLLHFTKRNASGRSAHFWDCKSLKIAEGNFAGFVDFDYSGVEKIGNLICGKDRKGNSAHFYGCRFLKVAKGNFAGRVSFLGAGIEKIENLTHSPA